MLFIIDIDELAVTDEAKFEGEMLLYAFAIKLLFEDPPELEAEPLALV